MEKKKKKEPGIIYIPDEKEEAPRFHYDGWRVHDDGKTIEIYVTPDDKLGKIVLPWEEIDKIRRCGWECQENAAQKIMKGKRVHCRHLQSFHALFPSCCQIGKESGPEHVNCLNCKYIDGYIEEYNPDEEIKTVAGSFELPV